MIVKYYNQFLLFGLCYHRVRIHRAPKLLEELHHVFSVGCVGKCEYGFGQVLTDRS